MQKLISKYGLAAHLAIVAVAPLFLSPAVVIWLSVLGAVWVIMEPSRFGNEMHHDARFRVSQSLLTDPLVWVLVGLVVISGFRALNTGVSMSYDAEHGKWMLSEAFFPLLPGSVKGSAFQLVGCAFAFLVVVSGCRHCLGRSARSAFALIAAFLSGAGALALSVYRLKSKLPVLALSSDASWMTDPAFEGVVYGVFLVCGIAALVTSLERQWRIMMLLSVVGVCGNLLGLFLFSPFVVALVYVAVALVVLIYAFVYLHLRLDSSAKFKYLVFVGMGAAFFVLVTQWLSTGLFSETRVEPLLAGKIVPDGYLELRGVLGDISARIWKQHPWLGCGCGSFPLALQFEATLEDWQAISPLQKSLLNGYWMILVERGVVGAFLLAAPFALLLVAYVRRLIKGVMRAFPHPLSWSGLLLVVVAALEMLVDNSFLTPGAAVALGAVFALSAAAFPKEMRSNV